MNDPTLAPQWQKLVNHSNTIADLVTLFENNDRRTEDLLIDFEGVCFDYSKQLIDKSNIINNYISLNEIIPINTLYLNQKYYL